MALEVVTFKLPWRETPLLRMRDETAFVPNQQLVVIARVRPGCDTTFASCVQKAGFTRRGRSGSSTSLEDRPRYTPTTTFETFPFPGTGSSPFDIPAADYANDPRAVAIAEAARRLVELRDRWLNPPEWVERAGLRAIMSPGDQRSRSRNDVLHRDQLAKATTEPAIPSALARCLVPFETAAKELNQTHAYQPLQILTGSPAMARRRPRDPDAWGSRSRSPTVGLRTFPRMRRCGNCRRST